MPETVIKVENLSKQYRIGAREGYKTFRETLVDATKVPIQGVQKLFNPKSRIRNYLGSQRRLFRSQTGKVVGFIDLAGSEEQRTI